MPLNSARSNCLDDNGKSDAAQVWNVVIARDAFSLEDLANPYSFFIALSID